MERRIRTAGSLRWPRLVLVVGAACALASATGCGGRMPEELGSSAGRLAPCPESPNCVSSQASDPLHAIPAFELAGTSATAWAALVDELEQRPRVEIVRREPDYLHAVFTTRLMRYRDDVEFRLDASRGEIAVRSASRIGHGDMGANRERIESLRAALAARGAVRPASDD